MTMKNNFYIDSDKLEECWSRWLQNEDDSKSWEELSNFIYQICNGVVVHFNPKNPEEHMELCHETFILTLEKIKSKRLIFESGKAPVFNLLTTTIFRHLYSLMNKTNRRNRLLCTKYLLKSNVMDKLVGAAGIDGDICYRHPDYIKLKSNLFANINNDNKV